MFILTDGSGRCGSPRLASTRRILSQTGAQPATPIGSCTDRELYEAILRADTAFFLGLVEELAAALDKAQVDYVGGDATEGFSPAHDICRAVIDTAVDLLGQRGKEIGNFDFVVHGRPDESPDASRLALWLVLDDEALARKVQAAASYRELAVEVDRALRGRGIRRAVRQCGIA